jgi:hypothetical protein
MLSIGKLAAGQAKYYLDQAEGRESEARGDWLGCASAELGLDGPVEGTQLRDLLAGLHPADGTPLRSSAHPVRVARST